MGKVTGKKRVSNRAEALVAHSGRRLDSLVGPYTLKCIKFGSLRLPPLIQLDSICTSENSATNHQQQAGHACQRRQVGTVEKEDVMLWTIVVILLILWLLGLVSSYTMGGMIHILLVIAVIMIVVNLIQGRRSL